MVNKLRLILASLFLSTGVYALQPQSQAPMTVTVPQNGNVVGVTINQNDTNNNPNALTTNGAVTVGSLTCTGSPCGTGSGGYAVQPATVSFQLNQGLAFGGINSVSSNYVAKSTDAFISVGASGGAITVTLDAASALKGQFLNIVKNDTSANAVTIITAGSDKIDYTTGTVILNAQGQGISFVSDGTSAWMTPNGIPATPPWLGRPDGPSAAQGVSASTTTQLISVYVPVPVRATGLRYVVGTQAGNCQYGLYDNGGVLLATSTETTCAAPGVATTSFTSAVNIPPGIYYMAMGAQNTTQTWTKSSGNGMFCNNFTVNIPMANVTLPGANTVNCFSVTLILTGGNSQ